MPLPVFLPLALLLLTPSPPTQSPRPIRVFGRATTLDGKPWAGAEVTLVSRPIPGFAPSGRLACTKTTTDADGRFRLEARRGQNYSCFALSPNPDSTSTPYRYSQIIDGVVPNHPLLLREAGRPRPRHSVEVLGLAPWRAHEPLQFRIWLDAQTVVDLPVERTADDRLLLPPVPHADLTIDIRTASGILIHDSTITPSSTPTRLRLAPPTKALFRVTVGHQGKPIEGAEILRSYRGELLLLGRTDADGYAVLERAEQHYIMPDGTSRGLQDIGRNLVVSKPGFQLGALTQRHLRMLDDRALAGARNTNKPHADSGLIPGVDSAGQLLFRDGVPAADLPLLVTAYAATQHHVRGSTRRSATRFVTTDAEGRFRLPGLPTDAVVTLLACLGAQHLEQIPAESHDGLDPVVRLSVPKPAADLGVFDLSRFALLDLMFRLPDGAPAVGARVLVRTDATREPGSVWASADRGGTLRQLWQAGTKAQIGVSHPAGWRFCSVTLAGNPGAGSAPAQVPIPLAATSYLQGRITTNGGTVPIADRRLEVYSYDTPKLVETAAPVRHGRVVVEDIQNPYTLMALYRAYPLRARTDAEGRYRVAVPDLPISFAVSAQAKIDGAWVTRRELLTLTPGTTGVIDIDLVK